MCSSTAPALLAETKKIFFYNNSFAIPYGTYRAKVKKPYIYEYFRVCISLYVCLSPESDQVTIESLEIGVVHARVLSLESTMYCLEL